MLIIYLLLYIIKYYFLMYIFYLYERKIGFLN